MSTFQDPADPGRSEESLFDEITEFLAEQSGDRIYEELTTAYALADTFAERELRGRIEYARMLRGIERLIDDGFGDEISQPLRGRLAEFLYLYGLAHYTLLQQSIEESEKQEAETAARTARPLTIYDVWFPSDIALERGDDGFYLHISDGRVDVTIFLGMTPNERGALVDFVDHWEYATANTQTTPGSGPDLASSVPLLAIEMDYAGSDLINAEDHVDVLLFDDQGEPVIRIHAKDSDLRAMVDEMQAIDQSGGL